MNENAIAVIEKYIEEHLFEPAASWPRFYFDQRSYARWAGYEILESVKKHSNTQAVITIERFIKKVDRFSYLNEDTHVGFIFSIAKDTALDIFDTVEFTNKRRTYE